jgi:predicted dehydrogenase
MIAALMRTRAGILATLNVNWLTPTKVRDLRVIGERGMFHVDLLTQDLYLYENNIVAQHEWDAMTVLRGVAEGQVTRFVVQKKEPLRAELEAFVAACNRERSAAVTLDDGLEALRLAQELVRCAEV